MNFSHFINKETKETFSEAEFEAVQFGSMLDGLVFLVEIKNGKLSFKPLSDSEALEVSDFLKEEINNLQELFSSAYEHLVFTVNSNNVYLCAK